MSKNFKFLFKIKREILKGFKRIYWFSFTRIKYFILTLNSLIKKKKQRKTKYRYYFQQKKDLINLEE